MKTIKFHWHYLFMLTTTLLIVTGLLLLSSASMNLSQQSHGTPFYFLIRQTCFVLFGLGISAIVIRMPIDFWEQFSVPSLLLSLTLLVVVLIPGIGHRVNGSIRWLNFRFVSLQVSELAKFGLVLYSANYLMRHQEELQQSIQSFFRLILILVIVACLLLMEPDFGALVVITLTLLAMLYIARARIIPFVLIFSLCILFLLTIATLSPYRMLRLTTFLNPWQHPFDSGYQLIQSLIAFGRGGIWGVGFGHSIQKLFYLPEAHTDFLFAIFAEEFGIVGQLFLLGLFVAFTLYGLQIAYAALKARLYFHCYLSFGLTLLIALQAIINICVNTGMLPTKGLTLPFISYGGSSILFNLISVAIILRVHHETMVTKPLFF